MLTGDTLLNALVLHNSNIFRFIDCEKGRWGKENQFGNEKKHGGVQVG